MALSPLSPFPAETINSLLLEVEQVQADLASNHLPSGKEL